MGRGRVGGRGEGSVLQWRDDEEMYFVSASTRIVVRRYCRVKSGKARTNLVGEMDS